MQEALKEFLQELPSYIHPAFLRNWENYLAAATAADLTLPTDPVFFHRLWPVLAHSDYAAEIFVRFPQYPLLCHDSRKTLGEIWSSFWQGDGDETSLIRALRHFRHLEMTRIIWRDLADQSSFNEHLRELSTLADFCVQTATDFLYCQLSAQYGEPYSEKGEKQPFIVIAVGKLGGEELNFSSDIDLIFSYPEPGTTKHERPLANEQFFTRLGQQLIKILSDNTEDGFVFRVDMRLRPNGQSGNLVMSFSALENYYQYHGRDWERYALIKARIITGTSRHGGQLLELLRPFVYRRYLDYGAFESLREMRDLVASEVKRRALEKDLKLGPGGIRQIEFLAQAFQLIRGGRERQFQDRRLLKILDYLAHASYITREACTQLCEAYIFLRRCEHRVQMLHDLQTHALPRDAIDRARVAHSLGYENWEAFKNDLQRHLARVSRHFNAVSAAPALESNQENGVHLPLIWNQLGENDAQASLANMGYSHPHEILQQLLQFKNSRLCQNLKKHALDRLDKLMPPLIQLMAKKDVTVETLSRMLRLLQSIVRRSAYLALLLEKPQVLSYLLDICGNSVWIVDQLCACPALLDDLLEPGVADAVDSPSDLGKELADSMQWLDKSDLEAQMDHLREFKAASFLRLAAWEVLGAKGMGPEYSLNDVTEVILSQIYELSVEFMTNHYQLAENPAQIKRKLPFGIVAYGNLGAKELHYASDLDLVFLYGSEDEGGALKDDLTATEFSIRLAQRIIHMLNTQTAAGKLFEVDVRLRPGGSAGLLVSHFPAFKKYLREHAWTFEHQALVKARMVVGDDDLSRRFEQLRGDILTMPRDTDALARDIVAMREKIVTTRQTKKNELKTISGGLADIEFILQYAILRWSSHYTELLGERSAIHILRRLSELKLIEGAEILSEAFAFYQASIRQKILRPEFEPDPAMIQEHQNQVQIVWHNIFGSVSELT